MVHEGCEVFEILMKRSSGLRLPKCGRSVTGGDSCLLLEDVTRQVYEGVRHEVAVTA